MHVLDLLSPTIDTISLPAQVTREILKHTGPMKVIEIGTAYGDQLPIFANFASSVVCVDAMYDWVPDLDTNQKFNPELVSLEKIGRWRANASKVERPVDLVVGSSYEVHSDPFLSEKFSGADILIVDGCHHPSSAVEADYVNFEKFLHPERYVIWDDTDIPDCNEAAEKVLNGLKGRGIEVSERVFHGKYSHCRVMYFNIQGYHNR